MRPLVTLVLLTTLGCESDLLGPGFTEELVHFGGCGDVVFYAVDSDDELMVTFVGSGLVAEAEQTGSEVSTVFELPAGDVELIVEQGSRVSDATCDDVIEGRGPRVERSWIATAGTATVRIRPGQDPSGARGDLVLEAVVFTSGDAALTVERLEWSNVGVGWYPG